jgi:hypothetical protein
VGVLGGKMRTRMLVLGWVRVLVGSRRVSRPDHELFHAVYRTW